MVNIDSLSSEIARVLYFNDNMPSDALKILREHNVELAELEIEDFKEEVLRWIDLVKQNINVLHLTTVVTQDYEAQIQIKSIIQEGLADFFDEISVEFKSSLDEPDSGEENSDEPDNERVCEIQGASQRGNDDKENKPRIFTAPESRASKKRQREDPYGPNIRTFR